MGTEENSWQKILNLIKDQISAANFRTWFSQASLGEISEKGLTIVVPSAFIKGQLIARYEGLIKDSIQKVLGKDLAISYQIDARKAYLPKKRVEEASEQIFFYESTPNSTQNTTSLLNPKYTLQNFVVGFTNNLAYAAAQAVSQNPGTSYNPLFIYGPSGVGKTHLMQAIGSALVSKDPYSKVVFVSSERFMNDFIDSIQTKKTGDFRQRYRQCSVLLIDDIQFIAGKDSTQEEFFHTFNELHSRNSQIVLTSDRPPNEMQKLESRLLSRFQGGLMVDIQLPDFDTRVAILKAKLKERGEQLPEEFLRLVAENIESNTRELEGKLVQILQLFKLSNQPPDLETVKKMIGKSLATISQSIDHKKVLSGINQYFNVKFSDLAGPRRQKELVLPRQIAMFLMYEDCKLPMEKIGQILGGRDHTTVLHGIEKIREAVTRDREVQRLVIEVRQQLST
ncbi:chromosomal replication initiator protein DnaA [Candidatus Daviesbacteria bacterium]|nr:chromosomal replication initiator protein DnaA [Candidatus Daviesbacteria bacterium]